MRLLRPVACIAGVLVVAIGITPAARAQTEPATSFALTPDKPLPDPKSSVPQTQTTGAFTRLVPIEAPAYFGIEPRLALTYSSQAGNGNAGVGWRLGGVSTIERTRNGRGSPRYDANDVFVLDGQQLLPCALASTSPGCAAGGTHATKNESDLRIKFDAAANTWTVWATSGLRTVFSPVYPTALGTFRWAQTSVIDPNGNTVSYSWAFTGGDAHLDAVTYGPFTVRVYRESRPDVGSFAIGVDTTLGWSMFRVRSVLVHRQGVPIRAYKLTYDPRSSPGRSLLIAVQQFGTDVQIDGAGAITGGAALPQQVFRYQQEPAPGVLHSWPDGAGL